MSGSVSIKSGSEDDLQTAVANVGPVSVAIDGANNAFRVSLSSLVHKAHTHLCVPVSGNEPWQVGDS